MTIAGEWEYVVDTSVTNALLGDVKSGLVDSWIVYEDDLTAFGGFDPKDAGPCCLRFVRDDGDFLPEHLVQESRFS